MSCLLRYFDTEHGRGEYEKYLNFESNFTSDGLIADSKMVSSRLVIYFDLWQTSSVSLFFLLLGNFSFLYMFGGYTSTYSILLYIASINGCFHERGWITGWLSNIISQMFKTRLAWIITLPATAFITNKKQAHQH